MRERGKSYTAMNSRKCNGKKEQRSGAFDLTILHTMLDLGHGEITDAPG
jgi:hypothetical protein